jgi:hypothetical protein
VGKAINEIQPRMGRKKMTPVNFLSPAPELKRPLAGQTHGFTVGYFLPPTAVG